MRRPATSRPVADARPERTYDTPLPAKLGIRAGSRVLLHRVPADVLGGALATLPPDVVLHHRPGRVPYDIVLNFATRAADLADRLSRDIERTTVNGAVWIAWPKRASGRPTDITDHVVREIALPLGVVDVKVCAVDETWTALKLVRRRENRG